MLYSPFGHIDFISVLALRWTVGEFLSTDMLKTQVASLKTSTCVSCLAASVPRQTGSNTWKSERYEYIFLPFSTSSRDPPPNHAKSFQNQLPITLSWKAAATQSLFVSDSFLSLCARVRTVLDLVRLWLCCTVFVQYWSVLVHGEMTMDQCEEGETVDNTQTTGIAKRIKETQNYTHIRDTYQSETAGEIYLSSLNPLSFLMLVFNVSFLPSWIPNDPYTKYSPLVRVLVWAVFLSETKQHYEICFAFTCYFVF